MSYEGSPLNRTITTNHTEVVQLISYAQIFELSESGRQRSRTMN